MFTHTGPKSRRYRFHVRCGEQHSRGQWCAKQTRTGCSRPTINIAYGMCFASHAAQVRGQLCGIVYIKLDRQGGSTRGGVVLCEFRHLTQVNRPQNTCGVSCVRTLAVRVSHFLVPASIHGGDSVSKTSTMLRACEHASGVCLTQICDVLTSSTHPAHPKEAFATGFTDGHPAQKMVM